MKLIQIRLEEELQRRLPDLVLLCPPWSDAVPGVLEVGGEEDVVVINLGRVGQDAATHNVVQDVVVLSHAPIGVGYYGSRSDSK